MKKFKIIILSFMLIFVVVGSLLIYVYLINNDLSQTDMKINEINTIKKNKIPEFQISDENGKTIYSSELIGKPTIINVWTSWCEYCKFEMEYFNDLYLNNKESINLIMLNATGDNDNKLDAKNVVLDNNYSFKIYYDENLEAIKKLKIYSYPTTIFIDKDGNIVHTKIGVIMKNDLNKMLKNIM